MSASSPDTSETRSGHAELNRLLERLGEGDRSALDELLPLVYDELHRIARGQRQRVSGRLTVNTTALVHEAYLKISQGKGQGFADRGHFLAVAATAMRQLLIDEAKRHAAQKRGSGQRPISLESVEVGVDAQAEGLLALDRAMSKLGKMSPRLLRVVECRFFGGLTENETAEVLGITDRTVRRDWVKARAWLALEMGGDGAGDSVASSAS
ncbi:MAG: RNA polymerase subunit sigma [Acidobacteria bacterium]|nr:MAG: RNA polymerase subunit sigma [Acidobacteriota bacterium]REJ99658.1 MAG: RNA polymerase subunit sigma [Acidobacteriota bacterium]